MKKVKIKLSDEPYSMSLREDFALNYEPEADLKLL